MGEGDLSTQREQALTEQERADASTSRQADARLNQIGQAAQSLPFMANTPLTDFGNPGSKAHAAVLTLLETPPSSPVDTQRIRGRSSLPNYDLNAQGQPAPAGFFTPTDSQQSPSTEGRDSDQNTPQAQAVPAQAAIENIANSTPAAPPNQNKSALSAEFSRTQVLAPKVKPLDGPGTPASRQRRAQFAAMAATGFDTVEQRADGNWLVNPTRKEELPLANAGDAQMARAVIAKVLPNGYDAGVTTGGVNDVNAGKAVDAAGAGDLSSSGVDRGQPGGGLSGSGQGFGPTADQSAGSSISSSGGDVPQDRVAVNRLAQIEGRPIALAPPNNARTKGLNKLLDAFAELTGHRGIAIYDTDPDAFDGVSKPGDAGPAYYEIGGYTVIVDGRPTAQTKAGAMGQPVGMRVLYLPEFEARYGVDPRLENATDDELSGIIKDRRINLRNFANAVLDRFDGVSFGGQFNYEVDVRFAGEYQGAIDGYASSNRPAGGGSGSGNPRPWQGRSNRESIAAATGRLQVDAGQPGPELSGGDSGTETRRSARDKGQRSWSSPSDRSTVRAAVHYGKRPGIVELSGQMSGTGIKGAEQERLSQPNINPLLKQRVYFYLPVPGGIPQAEIGLGSHVYTASRFYS